MKTYHFFMDNGITLEEISVMTNLSSQEAENEVRRLSEHYKRRIVAMVVAFECEPDEVKK